MAINAQFTADFSDYVRGTKQATDSLKDVERASQSVADQSASSLQGMKGFATELAGAFGIAFSVGALVSFGQELLTSTAALGDMSAATGITTDELQKLAYVGQGFGVSLPEISSAVGTLSDKLASGDASAAGAVERLGLNVEDLIALGPTEAFLTVAEAVGRVEDPMSKAGDASDIFGTKLGKTLIPYLGDLRTKMDEVPKDAIISAETIKSAADFDAGLSHLITRMKAFTAEAAASAWKTIFVTSFRAAAGASTETAEAVDTTTTATKNLATATGPAITAADRMANTLKAWRTEGLEPLSAAQKDAINLGIELGKSESEIAKATGASMAAVHQYTAAQKQRATDVKAAIADEQKAQIAYSDLLARLHREALEHQKDEAESRKKQTAVINAAVVDGNSQIMAAAAKLHDYEMKSSMDATTYQIMKIWEKAEAEIKAFKGTEQQAKTHADLVYSIADQEARAITDVMQSAVDQMVGMASAGLDKAKQKADAAVAAAKSYSMAGSGHQMTAAEYDEYYKTAAGQQDIIRNKGKRYYAGEIMPRAGGGPVSAGSPYLVGERGPELFVPRTSGSIVPGGNTNIFNITQPLGDPAAIASAVENALNSALRNSGVRLPSGA